jgi:SAM-dependent methyltransferase
MDEYSRSNRKLWDEWVPLHAASDFYHLDAFKAGVNVLNDLELGEVGPVAGKTLLHMQCHFGMDTLSWARLGAQVTGVDFSGEAIALAEQLAGEVNLPARFICSDIYALDEAVPEQFDIVYTSYGVLSWLPDIPRWAKLAAGHVKPGGFFYIAEFHPFAMVMDDEAPEYRLRYPYFDKNVMEFKVQGSYANRYGRVNTPIEYDWNHTLGEIVTSLIDAGLQIEFLHEHPFTVYEQLPFLKPVENNLWRPPEDPAMLPLMFSLRARKCA